MRLVLGAYYLNLPGGAVTYFATVADHLQRLGHEVTAFTHEPGPMAERLEAGGIAVVGPARLPEACDAILVQDAPCSYDLAERYPGVGQLFVSHGAEFDVEVPPQLPGVVEKVVVLNDRVRRRVEATALDAEVVRLTQPIDFTRFVPLEAPRRPPRLAILLGNYLTGARLDAVTGALDEAGIAWRRLGRRAEVSDDPALELNEADVVIGYGRSVLEGMSAGCAAYVDEFSADGWVTAESYPALEADGFAGTAFDTPPDVGRLARELAGYDPAMGTVNRELIVTRHSPFEHAKALAELLGGLAPRPPERAVTAEMSRLVRLEWEAQLRATHYQREAREMQRRTMVAEERAVDAERRALEAEGRLAEIKGSARYRLAQRLTAPLDRLRRRR
ncbi:MAG: hypothetical protein QOE65_1314 [Solirubrobacteraceae bacterium]|nr:hypothetical protein [Solirubrobacteraceae bacterium]